jgi:hypothetical protein
MEETTVKKCSGCKETKALGNFYKNKLVLDGHSNYCIECTRENSKRYFQRKKEKKSKQETDNMIKQAFFGVQNVNSSDTENLMKLLLIEKMLKSAMIEVESLKKNFFKMEEPITE